MSDSGDPSQDRQRELDREREAWEGAVPGHDYDIDGTVWPKSDLDRRLSAASDRWGDDDYMPMGPGFYLPCRRYFNADYLVLAHRMDGCSTCDAADLVTNPASTSLQED